MLNSRGLNIVIAVMAGLAGYALADSIIHITWVSFLFFGLLCGGALCFLEQNRRADKK